MTRTRKPHRPRPLAPIFRGAEKRQGAVSTGNTQAQTSSVMTFWEPGAWHVIATDPLGVTDTMSRLKTTEASSTESVGITDSLEVHVLSSSSHVDSQDAATPDQQSYVDGGDATTPDQPGYVDGGDATS